MSQGAKLVQLPPMERDFVERLYSLASVHGDCDELTDLLRGTLRKDKDFGPREDEDGEGVKPADPSDGAEKRKARSSTLGETAPDAEEQEGAESSRVGGPSISTDDESGTCICTDADDPNDHRKDCPQWGAISP